MNKFNFDTLCLTLLGVIGVSLIFATVSYNLQLKNECVLQAIAKEKTADDIKKICHER